MSVLSLAKSMKRYKVAFFDLDGTVINSAGCISPACRDAILALRERGTTVSIATGRPMFGAMQQMSELRVKDASMFFSGALICNPGSHKILNQVGIGIEILERLLTKLNSAGVYCELYTNTAYFVETPSRISEIHGTYLGGSPQVGDLFSIAESSSAILKVVLAAEGESERELITEITSGESDITISWSYAAGHPEIQFCNIVASEASREAAFQFLTRHFECSPSEVIAFGDAEADIPFLKLAGMGVAMGNASKLVKEAADYVALSVDQDGIPGTLRELKLI